jgi:hypothetical protein
VVDNKFRKEIQESKFKTIESENALEFLNFLRLSNPIWKQRRGDESDDTDDKEWYRN